MITANNGQSVTISSYIRSEDDLKAAIALLRLNYDRLAKTRCGLLSTEVQHQAISTLNTTPF